MLVNFRRFLGLMLVLGVWFYWTKPALADTPVIKFATESLPPFNYHDDQDRLVGPGVDIGTTICAELEIDCSFRLYPVNRLVQLIENADVDVVFSVAHNKAREKSFFFSIPFARTYYGFFVQEQTRRSLAISSPTDLDDFRIGVLTESNMLKTLTRLRDTLTKTDFQIIEENDLETAFLKLEKGRYGQGKAAIFSNRDTGKWIIANKRLSNLQYLFGTESIDYHFVFPKNRQTQEFTDRFNAVLKAMRTDGRLADILGRYGLDLPPAMANLAR